LIVIEPFATREELLEAERAAILNEFPIGELTNARTVLDSPIMDYFVKAHPSPTTDIGGWVASTRWRRMHGMSAWSPARRGAELD
jgi:hypothetical protein